MNENTVKTLLDLIVQSDAEYGDSPALSYVNEKPWTYHEVYRSACQLALTLREMGIKRGDRIALLSESNPYWGISYFAGVIAGAVMVPILPDFHENEILTILDHSEASILLISEKSAKKIDSKKIKQTTLKTQDVILRCKEPIEIELPEIDENDLLCIIYTSGTTGSSKGVMLTHKNVILNAYTACKIPRWADETRALSVLPLAHTYEFTIGFIVILVMHGSIYYMKRPPSTSVLIPALNKVKPHIMLSVPLLIEKIHDGIMKTKINNKKLLKFLYKIPLVRKKLNKVIGKGLMETFGNNLHFFGVGGAPLVKETEKFLREANFPFSIGYGITETSPLLAGGMGDMISFASTGSVLPNVEYELRKSEESGTGKELFVKGPTIMQGYYKDPEKTAEVLSEDGWFRTGDLGEIAEDGSLRIIGRAKNMILGSTGENIYPDQIEALINQEEFVVESLVLQDVKTKSLIARVHIDYDMFKESLKEGRIMREFHNLENKLRNKGDEVSLDDQITQFLNDLITRVNKELSSFSRISETLEQKEPFERTPTLKIKRYLYEVE